MIITLFGGAVVIALIYFILKWMGVSNYWRGVISGVIPTVGMVAYGLNRWPGGDVMTIHVAVYVATATVLTLGGGTKKSTGSPVHWIPALIIGFFVTLAVLMALFLSVAVRGLPPEIAQMVMPGKQTRIHTAFSGEVPHDAEAAKTISQYMKKSERMRQLGWQVEVDGLDGLRQGESKAVVVKILDKSGQPVEGATVSLTLKRPATTQSEQELPVTPLGAGKYQGKVQFDAPGQWVAILQIERGPDKFETAREILVQLM
ncbi:MAG: FixH family protein [Sulfuricella sp.]|nr:FixH family protein [Sulfuricella sp.]